MTIDDVKNLDRDDVLSLLGLQTRSSAAGSAAGWLAPLGVGLLVGAGIALLLAPKAGADLREDVRDKLRRATTTVAEAARRQAEDLRRKAEDLSDSV